MAGHILEHYAHPNFARRPRVLSLSCRGRSFGCVCQARHGDQYGHQDPLVQPLRERPLRREQHAYLPGEMLKVGPTPHPPRLPPFRDEHVVLPLAVDGFAIVFGTKGVLASETSTRG